MATQSLPTNSSVNLTGADAILKEYYPSAIVEQLNYKTFLLDKIDRDSDHIDFTGRRAIIPLHRNRNRGRASIGDGGVLPQAGVQDWVDATVQIRYHAASIELTDQAIQQSKSNDGAFISLLEAETKGVAQDLKKDINRQVFGTGDGILATCGTTSGTTTAVITLTSVQYVQVGDTIDVVVKSTGAPISNGSALVVTARSVANKTITCTVASTITTSSTNGIVLSNGYANNSLGKEMDGLQNISGTLNRTLHGVDASVAANSFWNPQVIAAGGAITEPLIVQLLDKIGQTGRGEADTIITTRGVRRAVSQIFTSNRRYTDAKAVELHGGYTAVMVNEVPMVIDDDCPKGQLFAFNSKSYKWFELAKPGFLEQDSGIFTLKDSYISGAAGAKAAVWQAFFRWYAAFGCTTPNLTGAITGITGDDDPV